jgi:hypothetical protein
MGNIILFQLFSIFILFLFQKLEKLDKFEKLEKYIFSYICRLLSKYFIFFSFNNILLLNFDKMRQN